ncbi:MAG: Rossmann-like and DUF2520 domain-containing protein [Pseudomonadota bacterium]
MTQQSSQIAIIGVGSVGIALGWLFEQAGHTVRLGSRNPSHAHNQLAQLLQDLGLPDNLSASISLPDEAVVGADLTLLTVTDYSISATCEQLAPGIKPGSVVAHCSGALDSETLATISEGKFKVCSLHPLNTFPNPAAALTLVADSQHQTCLYSEGDQAALDFCLPLFADVGFQAVQIQREAKPLYHAACVFACNYLTVLMNLSMETAKAAQIDGKQFWQSLQPLVQSTLHNFAQQGAAESLSGPIARGDTETVRNHLQKLAANSPDRQSAYAELGRRAVQLARERGELSESDLDGLEDALAGSIPDSNDP